MSFPVITNISDVLGVIEGHKEFYVSDKGDYKVINYQVAFADTFPAIVSLGDAIRRECRGIIFDNDGEIIRRPYHKFFNFREKEETSTLELSRSHVVLEKLDGSMVAPFIVNGEIIFGSKMGHTHY